MTSQYIYIPSTGSNVDLSARVRAYRTVMTAMAEEGSVGTSTVYVDDEDAGINIIGHRPFQWKETSESSNSRQIVGGFIADRTVNRGPFRVGRSRQWAVTVTDANTLLGRGIMRGSDANRPAETDVARIQWLMTTGEMNLITDSSLINTAGAVAMDANDYRNQKVFDIIDDCAQQSGKNYFVWTNEVPTPFTVGLFYDFNSSTAYSSSVRITNVLADVDSPHPLGPVWAVGSNSTYAAVNDDLELTRDPSRVYSSVLEPYNGGDVFVTDDSIRIAFARRDTTAPAVNVHTAAKATARALRYLRDIATEEDRLTMSYLVPLDHVNRLMQGHTYQVKFSHLPGYTDWTWVRALNRTVEAISEEFYKVTLEASPASATGTANSCSTAISSTVDTGQVTEATGFGPVSVPVNAASFNSAMQISFFSYVGPLMGLGGCAPLVVGGSGWSTLDEWSNLGDAGWVAVGYNYQPTIATPANMTVSATCSGGGPAEYFGHTFAFPASSTSPVQQSPITGSGNAILPSTPTVGDILYFWTISSTSGSDTTQWTTPGGTILVNNVPYNGGQWYLCIGIRCVIAGDTTTIRVPSGSHANLSGLSEWRP